MSDIDKFRNPNAPALACGVNQLLTDLSSEGTHHSEGQFSVSLEKALEKLKQFQLQDPHFYVLNLVSAAILRRATSFDVFLDKTEDVIKFWGEKFTKSQLQDIFFSEDPALKELAVALTAARSLNYESIKFESEGTLLWEDETPEFGDGGQNFSTLTLVKRKKKKRFREPQEWQQVWNPRSEQALKQSCRLASLPITIGYREVNRTILQVEAPALRIEHEDFELPSIRKFGHKEKKIVSLPSSGRYSAFLCGDIEKAMNDTLRDPRNSPNWYFVFRGITYTRTIEQLDIGGLGGVVISDGFSKDLSHSDIVENQFFQDLVEDIRDKLSLYVREHLTLQALPEHGSRNWFKAASFVGEILHQAGDEKEAARVEAWVYGHRAKRNLLTAEQCRNLADRFEQPLVFLLDYFHWNSLVSVEKQLRVLSGHSTRSKAHETLLTPWLSGAQHESMPMLFHALLQTFPKDITWVTLSDLTSTLASKLSPENLRSKVLLPLKQRLEKMTDRVDDSISFCQAASFLHHLNTLDFGEWFEKSLDSGLIFPTSEVRSWAQTSTHNMATEDLLERFDRNEIHKKRREADEAFATLLDSSGNSVKSIREPLEAVLDSTDDPRERSELLALLCLVDFQAKEKPSPHYLGWQSHRAALICTIQGDFFKAQTFHKAAHQSLQEDWFSHLLMGDNALDRKKRGEALYHYTKSCELKPSSISEEAISEISDPVRQEELWLNLARSSTATRLESYFAYSELLQLPFVEMNFAKWVKVRALTSYAEHSAGKIPRLDWTSSALTLSIKHPSVVRAHVRDLRRKSSFDQASRELALYRLAQQLSQSVPLRLQWKERYLEAIDINASPPA